MGIERASGRGLVLVGAQGLLEVVALSRVGVAAGVEDLGDRAPSRPAGQDVLFSGGGMAGLALGSMSVSMAARFAVSRAFAPDGTAMVVPGR